MTGRTRMKNAMEVSKAMVRYNMKIIFGNKFIYFLGAAVFIFLAVTAINLYNADSTMDEGAIYALLMVPGLLLVFYPSAFGIQNDLDCRMLEILFGIPNYRYKVWLLRLWMVFLLIAGIELVLAGLTSLVLASFGIGAMLLQVMFPIVFIGCVGFMVSTLVRNGSGTAVVLSVFCFLDWVGSPSSVSNWKWHVFLNPYSLPRDANPVAWADIILANRVMLGVGRSRGPALRSAEPSAPREISLKKHVEVKRRTMAAYPNTDKKKVDHMSIAKTYDQPEMYFHL